jgi:hypothetical protein
MGVTGFSYEANIFTTGGYAAIGHYQTYISGPGGEYRWVGPAPNPTVDWLTLDVPLVESEWTRVSGSWSDTVADIAEFRIVMAYYTGTYPHEITGVDNIRLNAVPVPAAAWFDWVIRFQDKRALAKRRLSSARTPYKCPYHITSI